MTLDEQFACAVLPDRWRVCGRVLRPIALGHLLVLQRLGSPFLVGGLPGPSDLSVALYVCSHRATDVMDAWHETLPRKWRWLGYRVALLATFWPAVYLTRCAMFAEYLAESNRAPAVWMPQNNDRVRKATTPRLLHFHSQLMRCGLSSADAWNTPMELARFIIDARLEEDGIVTFRSEHEREVAEMNAAAN